MEVDDLRTFVEVMRRKSFAAVARARDVAPSSISRTIGTLEQRLGVRLFQRTTRRLAPTAAALAYFDRIEPIIDELEQAALVAVDSGETMRGTLRVTASVAFAQHNVVPLVPEFSRRHPEIVFELLLTDSMVDLIEQRVDLAIRIGHLADSTMIAHRLCDLVNVVCASPEYLRQRGRPKTPADLEKHACLRYPMAGYGPRWRFRRGDGALTEVAVRGPVVATNGTALCQCAAAGMGIAMLPRWNVADELKRGALIELFAELRASASELDLAAWMLYPSRSYLPLKVRAFADYLKQQFAAGAPAERGLAVHSSKRGR